MNAITLPFIRKIYYFSNEPDVSTIAHEKEHLWQIERDGDVWFSLNYAGQFLTGPYRNISYEKESEDAAGETIKVSTIREMIVIRTCIWLGLMLILGFLFIKKP